MDTTDTGKRHVGTARGSAETAQSVATTATVLTNLDAPDAVEDRAGAAKILRPVQLKKEA